MWRRISLPGERFGALTTKPKRSKKLFSIWNVQNVKIWGLRKNRPGSDCFLYVHQDGAIIFEHWFLEKNFKLEILDPKTAADGQRASPYWQSQTCEIKRKNDPKLCPNYETDKYRCRPPRKFYPKFDINNECCPKVIFLTSL